MRVKNLRALREAKGMTQVEFSARAGRSQSLVSQHERGQKGASFDTIRAYAKALGMSRRWHALVGD